MKIFLTLLIWLAPFSLSIQLRAMNRKDIDKLNAKLLAEDNKQEKEKKQLEEKAPKSEEKAYKRLKSSKKKKSELKKIGGEKCCSCICLREFSIPLTLFLCTLALGAGGTYCKISKTCMYDTQNDMSINGTATNNFVRIQAKMNTLQQHNIIASQAYAAQKKYKLHPIKHRRWEKRKK